MVNVEAINNCIACGHDTLIPVLDLKEQPLANSYKKSRDEVQETYPLAIVRCDNCYHVQLTHRVNPDLMFKDYLYVSGTAKSQLEYFDWFSQFASEKFGTKPRTVLDIGCNDGSQLNYFQDQGAQTYGVDPAENLYATSSQRHEVVCGYFTGKEFSQSFDVIVCQNAFAHNYDQLELLQNIRNVMHKDSLLFATTSQSDMILNGEFDTIYHEHLSFYNIKSIDALCKRADLHLVDVVKSPVHGTSYIFIISKFSKAPKTIENLIALETKSGLYFPETYVQYYERCNDILKKFKNIVQEMKEQGITTVGLGAPAKGNTLLNAAETSLDFIIDENPLKQGLFTPGSSVPIYGMNHLDNFKYFDTICFIPLAWNFYGEMKRKVQTYRVGKKDVFVKYFPKFSIEK
jgi:SAM-dependent methyltransferase